MKDATARRKSLTCRIICTFYHCPRTLACLIFGNEHKVHHRIITGVLIIILATLLGNMNFANTALHIFCDSTSRLAEAMGSVPIIEHLGRIANGIISQTPTTTETEMPYIGEVIDEPVAEEEEEQQMAA